MNRFVDNRFLDQSGRFYDHGSEVVPPEVDNLLLESGDNFLLESGDLLLLES